MSGFANGNIGVTFSAQENVSKAAKEISEGLKDVQEELKETGEAAKEAAQGVEKAEKAARKAAEAFGGGGSAGGASGGGGSVGGGSSGGGSSGGGASPAGGGGSGKGLGPAVKNTAGHLGHLRERFDKLEQPLSSMRGLMDELGASTSSMGGRAASLGQELFSTFADGGPLFLGIAAVGAGLSALAAHIHEVDVSSRQIRQLRITFGVTAEEVDKLASQVEDLGLEIDRISLQKFVAMAMEAGVTKEELGKLAKEAKDYADLHGVDAETALQKMLDRDKEKIREVYPLLVKYTEELGKLKEGADFGFRKDAVQAAENYGAAIQQITKLETEWGQEIARRVTLEREGGLSQAQLDESNARIAVIQKRIATLRQDAKEAQEALGKIGEVAVETARQAAEKGTGSTKGPTVEAQERENEARQRAMDLAVQKIVDEERALQERLADIIAEGKPLEELQRQEDKALAYLDEQLAKWPEKQAEIEAARLAVQERFRQRRQDLQDKEDKISAEAWAKAKAKAAEAAKREQEKAEEFRKVGIGWGVELAEGFRSAFSKDGDAADVMRAAISVIASMLDMALPGVGQAFGFLGGFLADGGPIQGHGIPKRRSGGPHIDADGRLYEGHPGEFVFSAPAVAGLGGMDRVAQIHEDARLGRVPLGLLGGGGVGGGVQIAISAFDAVGTLGALSRTLEPAEVQRIAYRQGQILASKIKRVR